MGLFSRRKTPDTAPSKDTAAPVNEAPFIGGAALADVAQLTGTETVNPKQVADRVRKFTADINKVYKNQLQHWAAEGKDETTAQAAAVEGWNNASLPRAVLSVEYRGGGAIFWVLNGTVPGNFFDYFEDAPQETESGLVLPTTTDPDGKPFGANAMITLEYPGDTLPTEPNPDDPAAFYAEKIALPQVAPLYSGSESGENVNWSNAEAQVSRLEALLSPHQQV